MNESPAETKLRTCFPQARIDFYCGLDQAEIYKKLWRGGANQVFRCSGILFEGFVTEVKITDHDVKVGIMPTGVPRFATDITRVVDLDDPYDHPGRARFNERYCVKPQFKKEDSMKLYEVVIVKVNEKGEVEDSMFDQPELVTARTASEAREQVLVDFAADQGLTGKDLSGYRVGTREFLLQA